MIDLVVSARVRDVAGMPVRRALPSMVRRHVGPFVFLDHMGPVVQKVDVPPHPHIGLATVTYLFDGEITHRDSIGSERQIKPGDVNWMIAGRGIAHSERGTSRAHHGIQSWVALPTEHEQDAPSFHHHAASTLPRIELDGASHDVIAGTAFGKTSPVAVHSPTLYVHSRLEARARVTLDDAHEERAVYVVSGELEIERQTFSAGSLVIFASGPCVIESVTPSRAMILGGARLGERHIWWNFVSTSTERIERAKDDWKNARFSKVRGDEIDFVPLPESKHDH